MVLIISYFTKTIIALKDRVIDIYKTQKILNTIILKKLLCKILSVYLFVMLPKCGKRNFPHFY